MGRSEVQIIGHRAERYCAEVLRDQAYSILEQNYSWPGVAEVDLIALRDDQLLFIEVKARQASEAYGGPAGAISQAKLRRLTLAAKRYVQDRSLASYNIHLVAALVELNAGAYPVSCKFVEV